MKKDILKNQKGFQAIIIIVAIALVIMAVAGVGGYYLLKNKNAPKDQSAAATTEAAPQAVDDINVTGPDLDFKFSPLPALGISTVKLDLPAMPASNLAADVAVNSDFSYTGDTDLESPAIVFDVATPDFSAVPDTSDSAAPDTADQPSTDCGQFSAVPSCSYVGAPGSQGYELCKTCYPSK